MATLDELVMAVATPREAGCTELMLLKCTSAYPALPQNAIVSITPHLNCLSDAEVGLSHKTMGFVVAVAAVALDASAVENTLLWFVLMVVWIVPFA